MWRMNGVCGVWKACVAFGGCVWHVEGVRGV